MSEQCTESKALQTVKALQQNRFSAEYCQTAADAWKQALALISPDAIVGIAGSDTLIQLKATEELDARGNTVYCHHRPGLSAEEILDIRRKQLTCDVFLTSTNAITEDGRLVNTDGTGNRVAAMMFGPKKCIIIAGENKIVADAHAALQRIRKIAAPRNNKRLNRPNPCVQTGECMDCQGPTRICNMTTTLHKKPPASDIHIIVVGETLGY